MNAAMEYVLPTLTLIAIGIFLALFTGELNATNGRARLRQMAVFSYLAPDCARWRCSAICSR